MGYFELKTKLKSKPPVKIAVTQATGEEIFTALGEAANENLCFPILVGNKQSITSSTEHFDLKSFEIIEATDNKDAAAKAVQAVRSGIADLIMKGNIPTDQLMKEVLDKEQGLRTGSLLSHIVVFETDEHQFLGVTDGGINIQPDVPTKIAIINNAVSLFRKLGIDQPRVAVLSATEKVNPKIPSSVDAAAIVELAKQGAIKNAIVNGPVSFDIATDEHARKIKEVDQIITGNANILVVPEIVCGNVLGKSLIYKAKYPSGGIVIGAACPIILLSRSDSSTEKLNSIILGASLCSAS
jgi:phosphate butyryltransferase